MTKNLVACNDAVNHSAIFHIIGYMYIFGCVIVTYPIISHQSSKMRCKKIAAIIQLCPKSHIFRIKFYSVRILCTLPLSLSATLSHPVSLFPLRSLQNNCLFGYCSDTFARIAFIGRRMRGWFGYGQTIILFVFAHSFLFLLSLCVFMGRQ